MMVTKSLLPSTIAIIVTLAISSYGKQPCRDSDSLCFRYYKIWKDLVKDRNFLSEEYFQTHIFPTEAGTGPRGKSGDVDFVIWYKVKIDWAEMACYNQFVIKIGEAGTYLTEKELVPILIKGAYGSSILKMIPLEKLKYSSQEEAVKALQEIANCDRLKFRAASLYVPGRIPRVDGYPYLLGWGEIDESENKCIVGYINLVTGEGQAHETVCVIYN